MADHVSETLKELSELAQSHQRVAVGFSGGKDSLATLDLAVKHFKQVIPFNYYFVPGLKSEDAKLNIAVERYGLTVRRYPSKAGLQALKEGLLCDELADIELFDEAMMQAWVLDDTRASLILTGVKKADGTFRRRKIGADAKLEHKNHMVYPIRDWLKWEVLSYCKANRIPIPDAGSGDNGSISLIDSEILHAYDHNRADYERLKEFFPYIDTVVLRRQWFGK